MLLCQSSLRTATKVAAAALLVLSIVVTSSSSCAYTAEAFQQQQQQQRHQQQQQLTTVTSRTPAKLSTRNTSLLSFHRSSHMNKESLRLMSELKSTLASSLSLSLSSSPSARSVVVGKRKRRSKFGLVSSVKNGGGSRGVPLAAASTSSSSADFVDEEDSSSSSIFRKILDGMSKISNIASLLCVIDCTVLPIVTLILPLFGLAASPAQSAWLHELGHKVALGFVLPVGGLAATMNFLSHRKFQLTAPATLGLSLIYAANGGHDMPLLNLLPHDIAHALHCGSWIHRSVNIVGCALLLGSNYVSHRAVCTHDHGHHHHHHSHSCSHDH